jgi:hypothetical protein
MKYTNSALGSNLEQALSSSKIVKHDDTWELVGLPTMSRPNYENFKKVLAALGGSWNGKTHLFWRDPSSAIQELLEVGKMPQINPYSLFETPDCAIDDLFLLLDMPEGEYDNPWRILEPSAGRGAIARRIRERLPNAQIDCFEIDPVNREALEAQGFNVIGHDFLEADIKGDYHFVVMNPPFERDAYVAHVTKAYSYVARGGKLGAIAPNSLTFGKTKAVTTLRNLIAERGYCEDIGSPFETTKTRCVAFTMNHYDQEDLERVWARKYGYASGILYEVILHLDNEPEWHKAMEKGQTNREAIGSLADSLVEKYCKDCHLLYWDEKIRNQCIDQFLKHIEPEEPVKTRQQLYEEAQLSFFAPA